MSKSAKSRAAKQARDVRYAEARRTEEEVPVPALAAQATQTVPAPMQVKSKSGCAPAQAKSNAGAPAVTVLPAAKSKASPKQVAGKGKGKTKEGTKQSQPSPTLPVTDVDGVQITYDDGSGPVFQTISKKQQKRKEKDEDESNQGASATTQKPGKSTRNPSAKNISTDERRARIQNAIQADIDKILNMKGPGLKGESAKQEIKAEEGHVSKSVTVAENKIGVVIGPRGGSTVKMLMEKGGVAKIDTVKNVFTITGLPDQVAVVEKAIKDLEQKGYTSLAYDDFDEAIVMVPTGSVSELIGERGSMVRLIKEKTECGINIPQTRADKQIRVVIAGNAVQVQKAKEIVNDIVLYHHHEETHPGQIHQELDIEAEHYKFIIGTGGAEMKHIRNNFKVQLHIPKKDSNTEKVLVIGHPDAVARASKYIESQVAEKSSQATSRPDIKNDDQ